MICDNGHPEIEMELETSVTDYHDPADAHGHGQHVTQVWVCPLCENVEPLEEDDL